MAFGETLKSFRKGDYGEKDDGNDEEGSSSHRMITLTGEEAKELEPYQEKFGPGQEMVIEATGKLEGDHFHIMSVKYAKDSGMDVNADAEAVMSKMRGPITPMQVQPSPS